MERIARDRASSLKERLHLEIARSRLDRTRTLRHGHPLRALSATSITYTTRPRDFLANLNAEAWRARCLMTCRE